MSSRENLYDAIRKLDESIKERMSRIKFRITILSGKGGVGKSVITANLALALASKGYNVGILDADVTGPSIPKILGVRTKGLSAGSSGVEPVIGPLDIRIVSMDYLLPNDYTPVIWRGPLKSTAIKQFLGNINWGELEYLIIDLPPGTGDESLTIAQSIPNLSGAIIVTIPSEVSQVVVKRAITFCRILKISIIGVIENMSGFICPHCGAEVNVFMKGGGKRMAEEMGVKFLGAVPLDQRLCEASDKGELFILENSESSTAKAFMNIVELIEKYFSNIKSN